MDAAERQAIQHACTELVLRAAARADAGDVAGLAQLFAPQGMLSRPNAQPLEGRDAIEAAYAQRPPTRITRHLITNTLVNVESPTQARALSYVLLWAGSADDAAGPHGRPVHGRPMVGEFEDVFSLEPQGWRILRREARFVLHARD